MRRPPVLLSGRSPRLVLLVSPAPPVPAEAVASLWRRALLGCLAPGYLGPLKAPVRLWRHASACLLLGSLLPGTLMPLNVLAAPCRWAPRGFLVPAMVRAWQRAPSGCALLGLLMPLKALAASWRRVAPDCLPPGRPGSLKALAAS